MTKYAPIHRGSVLPPLLDAEYHREVAKRLVDVGLVSMVIGWLFLVAVGGEAGKLGAFVAASMLVFGAGLYLPVYFIGQDLFDASGYSTLPFVYGFGLAGTFAVLAMFVLAPVDVQVFVYFVLLVTIAGGRVEIEGEFV
jgi:drug/metabolite transporter (DMT)-like permease